MCKRNRSRFNLLHCCSSQMSTHFMDPSGHLSEYTAISIHWFQWWILTCPTLTHPSIPIVISIGQCPIWVSFYRPGFHCPLPIHMVRPLTIDQSGKNWNRGFYNCAILPSLLRKRYVIHLTELMCFYLLQSGSLPNKILSIHLGTAIHKPSSSLSLSQELSIGYCPSNDRI